MKSDSPLETVLNRLENVKQYNGYYKAVCPAHEDNEPSLSIKMEDGKVLLHCFAGCSTEEIVAEIKLEMSDLFEGGGEGGVVPLRTPAQVHTPQENTHDKAKKGSAQGSAHANAQPAQGATVETYAEYVGLPIPFLKGLGLKEIQYGEHKAVRIPYLDRLGAEEVCIRFRVSLAGSPKIKTRKGDKHRLYGLQSIKEMQAKAGYVILVEGESDTHVGWYHDQPVVGVPGAAGFQSEWVEELEGFEKIYAVVEPDEAGEKFWQRLAAEPSLQDRLYKVRLEGAKDLRELHLQEGDFSVRLREALDRAVHWMDIAESEALERNREAWKKCATLAGEGDILERFYATLRMSGVAGEEKTAKILYLALTSRRLARPVSIVVKGPSSGGKSFLVEKVAEHFPESAVYALTAMSEKVLAYSEEPIKHRFLILYEASGMNNDFQTYLIRSLLSEGRLRYETVEKTDQGIEARLIEREGPTGLIVTTTLARLHPENETRMLSLTVTDTQEQTSHVLAALADEGLRPPDPEEWRAVQEWLEGAAQNVTIPFAKELARLIPPVAVRLRRDFSAILNLIRAHALLHQHTREIDDGGRVVATIEEDYATVRELVADLVAEGVDASVPETVKETVHAVEQLTAGGGDDEDDGPLTASVRQVADELKLDRSAAQRRLYDAANKGYLKNLEDRRGRPGRYLLGDPLPADVVILPTVEELLMCCEGVHTPLHTPVHTPDAPNNADSEEGCAGVHVVSEGKDPLPSPRLTTEQVLEIRTLIAQGMSAEAARNEVLGIDEDGNYVF